MTTRFKLLFLLAIAALLAGSCTNPFHPELSNNNEEIEAFQTPDALLHTLRDAYTQKNINLFSACLAPDFRFELLSAEVNTIGIDWNNDGIKDSWWGYEQEVEYHRNLFIEGSSDGSYPPPDQINLTLQVPPDTQWENDPEVGHETWKVIPCLFNLQLIYSTGTSSLSSNGVARFFVKPVGKRWFIAVWRDESNI
ncbi:MAG TPA: hypothetical protein PLF50_03995 [Candidatus Cloacimonadota bacterium]|nr:hypothetical protein [Candidatus Cloacimonadota bacterium]